MVCVDVARVQCEVKVLFGRQWLNRRIDELLFNQRHPLCTRAFMWEIAWTAERRMKGARGDDDETRIA